MFFNLINFLPIKDKAYNYLLSLCDRVEFLYSNYNNLSCFECDIFESEYSEVLKQFKSIKNGESWGMNGNVVSYKLTEGIKTLIKDQSLNMRLKLTENSFLENITLYNGNNIMFSICSHEGYEHIDDKFEKEVSNYCLKEVELTTLYNLLECKFDGYKNNSIEKISQDLYILKDINAYVEDSLKKVIRISPQIKVSFAEYLNIAKIYLSNNILNNIMHFNDFKDFFPVGCPTTFDEIESFIGKEQFVNTDIYKEIMEEIMLIEVILYKKCKVENIFELYNKINNPKIIVNK